MKDLLGVINKMRTILNMEPLKEDEVNEEINEEVVENEKQVNFAQAELENGDVIYYDGELGLDSAVYSDEEMETPVEDGQYVLTNGDTFTTEGGRITAYEKIEEPSEEEMEEVDFEKEYNDLKTVVDELKEKLQEFAENEENLKKEIEEFKSKETEMKSQIEKLSAEPSVEPVSQSNQEKRELTDVEKKLNALDAIRKLRKK